MLGPRLPLVMGIIANLCKKYHLGSAECADFRSQVTAHLLKGKALEQSDAYLAASIIHFLKDLHRAEHGRQRASAAALAEGPLAVEMEELLDAGWSLREICTKWHTEGKTGLSDLELARLRQKLPFRAGRRPEFVPEEAGVNMGGGTKADHDLRAAEWRAGIGAFIEAVRRYLEELPPEDAYLGRACILDRTAVSVVARVLGVEARPLYRRLVDIKAQLRTRLEEDGISRARIEEWLGEGDDFRD